MPSAIPAGRSAGAEAIHHRHELLRCSLGEYWADADLALKIRHARKKILLLSAIRATWHAPARPAPGDPVYNAALYSADRVLGAALLLRKHEGFFAGLTFRLSAIVSALLHFDFRLFGALLSGEKVGSQAS